MKNVLIFLIVISCTVIPAIAFAHEHAIEMQAKIKSIQQDMRKDLSEGRTEKARNALEKASGNFHAIEIELGLIQTLMQAGEYRHALSAAAHTQAEHPDEIDSTLLYAWLMAIGGQTNPTTQLIEATLARHPEDAALTLMLTQIKARQLISAEIKTSDAIQLKPFTSARIPNAKVRKHLTTGILINDEKHVITSLTTVEDTKILQVRNGLGREVNAHIEQIFPTANIAVLKLDKPLKTATKVILADKTPFPGSPIYIIGFTPATGDAADWPQLKVDILGTAPSATSGYPIHVKKAATGSGVFNQQGHLIGIVDSDNNKIMLPLDPLTDYKKSSKAPTASGKLAMDEIYENALSNAVQVLGK
ncbi:MAG: trypsin-like peptidase domain-containing protein [Pseudomonadota bacterium]